MKIKTCVPPKLPLRTIQWESFADLLGKAHAAVARYDEALKSAKDRKAVLPTLLAQEAIASVESKKTRTHLKKVLGHSGSRKAAKDSLSLISIVNYRTALLKGGEKIKRHPFSGALICELHGIIRKDAPVSKNDIGKWRDRQNWIGPEGCGMKDAYFFPPTLKVMHKSLKKWFHYLNFQDKDPLVQLAIAFAQLLAIHPYMDGNGRIARALVPLFLYKKKVTAHPIVFLSGYFQRNRLKYFEKLFAVNSENHWEEWIRFFLQGVIEACDANRKKAQRILAKHH